MAAPWNEIDWKAEPPSRDDIVESWRALRWIPRPIRLDAVDAYLAEVERTHIKVGYVIGRWAATGFTDVTSWCLSRNRFDEYELFRVFFEDPGVQEGLAELHLAGHAPALVESLEQSWSGALSLDGKLAAHIVNGGAYEAYDGPASAAKDLAAAAVDALTERRYEDIRVDSTYQAWSPWFPGIFWDHTYVITDRLRAEITVLGIADRD